MATEQLIIKVRADGTRIVTRGIGAIGVSATGAEQGVALLRKALLFVGVVASLRKVIGTLASFSQSISTVKAITGATGAEFEALADRARELGTTTRFTASQAAEGMTELARAGFEVEEVLKSVEDVLLLAQAGNLELGRAAQITAGAIRGFNLQASDAQRVTDVLAVTANSAATDVNELGEALKFVAPVAKDLGVQIETVAAALGVLADNQLRGTLGGTGLRKVLSTLAKGAPPLKKALSAVGLTLADVDVASLGLAGALKNLEKANIGVGEAFRIFGDRGQPAFSVLVSNIPRVEEFDKKLQSAGGATREIARIMDENLNGALLRVKSALEGIILEFGKLGADNTLVQFFDELAGVLRTVADNVDILAGAMAGLAVTQIPLLIRGIRALTLVLAKNPLGLFIIAIGVTIGASQELRDIIVAVFEQITDSLSTVSFGKFIGGVKGISFSFSSLLDVVILVFDSIVAFGVASVAQIRSVFVNLPAAIGDAFFLMLNSVLTFFNAIILKITSAINELRVKLEQASREIPGLAINFNTLIAPQADLVKNPFVDAAKNLGDVSGEAFRIAFEKQAQSRGTGFADSVKERIAALQRERSLGADAGGGDSDVGVPPLLARPTELKTEVDALNESLGETAAKFFLGEEAGGAFAESMRMSKITAEEFGATLAGLAIGAVDALSGAIADLAVSGFKDFESFKESLSNIFRDLAREIIKLVIKFLILRAISAAFDTGGGAAPTPGVISSGPNIGVPELLLRPGLQAGGPLAAGDSRIVGERGPELFTSTRSGNITPASGTAAAMQSVNLTIIQVDSQEAALAAMASAEGETIILAAMNKNPGAVEAARR